METKRTGNSQKMAEWIVETAKGIASTTVNKSVLFNVYERPVPEEVKEYLKKK